MEAEFFVCDFRFEWMKLPTPRDLNEPDGWRRSSLRKIRHPASLDSLADSINGVSIQGFLISGEEVMVNIVGCEKKERGRRKREVDLE